MSAIDDLKNGINIDTTSDSSNDPISVELGNENSSNVINMSNLNNKGRHQIILPKNKEAKNTNNNSNGISIDATSAPTGTATSNGRKVISIGTLVDENKDDDVKESIEADLLDMDNPDSIMSKYLKEQIKEKSEWEAEKAEEAEVNKIMEDEDNIVNDLVGGDPAEGEEEKSEIYEDKADERIVFSNVDKSSIVTEDISGLFAKDNNKEEENMPVNENKEEVVESTDTAEEVDVEIEDEDVESAPLEEDTKEEKKEEKKEEPIVVSIDAPDIDVDVNDTSTFNVEDDDIEEEKESTVAEVDRDETLKHLQKLATDRLKPVSQSLNISSFTVLKKPVVDVSKTLKSSSAKVAKWVIPNQESTILMKEFSGSELEKLREYSENNRSIDSLQRRFRIIYDHIESPKPASFETWLRTTPFEDIDHYFFAIYIASFKGANYLPADCPNKDCKETFLTEDINIMDMVKFDTEEAKTKFTELYQSDATPAGKGIYCTEIVPLSDKVAISFRQPSVNNLFEIASINDKSRERFASIIEYIPYIDTMYIIDAENQTLTPVSYKMYPDNTTKTIVSKIAKYDSIFSSLRADEFGPIKAYIRAIAEKKSGMHYVYPVTTCPKCGATTAEITTTAEELVFTRYQLGALTTTSLK